MSQRLLEEITARLVSTTAHAERLRTQLTEAEDDLDRLRVAEQVVKEILAEVPAAEQACGAGQDPADMPTPVYRVALTAARAAAQAERGVEFLSGGRLIPFRHEADDAGDLPADYQALLAAVDAAGGPVICKAICEQLGLPVASGQVEGVRAKLKRLAERGRLRKTPSGAFAPSS
ncbi:hypothetical protein FHR32_006091 [Streptosporangium album]|uniref:Uncharacterized protein n=1 Tax=Streptosporangium album TaxID=47479 RepID=A0A7W7WCW8_9ACTN|nr:hypothetical protein [Streptosporangium album]MBB4936565.1 hypothetical protein [Streptosporangium album]MBB4941714.1 hypothetical protein [Streptosporangium album]